MPNSISVIIPTLNEADRIGRLLASFEELNTGVEVIVVDGGSIDSTVEIATAFGAVVVRAKRGRGSQMHAGAEIANGDVLWFVHADTIPSKNAMCQIKTAVSDSMTVAGNFTIRFDGDSFGPKFLTWLYPKLRMLGLIYGDSTIFVRRNIYERIGGFRPFPIFEDLDLINRLKVEGEIVTLPGFVHTSARRIENRCFVLEFGRWVFLQILYWIGVSPHQLGEMYFSRGAE